MYELFLQHCVLIYSCDSLTLGDMRFPLAFTAQ